MGRIQKDEACTYLKTLMVYDDSLFTDPQGRTLLKEPPWTLEVLEAGSPPVPFSEIKSSGPKPQILSRIRVLELCRIIAGPAVGRTLAEYGADVIKVTSPYLSDVPFFQVDGYVKDSHYPPLSLLHHTHFILRLMTGLCSNTACLSTTYCFILHRISYNSLLCATLFCQS